MPTLQILNFYEIGSWLHEVGFTDVRTLPVPAPFPLILATKPNYQTENLQRERTG